MPSNNVQTHECIDLDKVELMIQSNRLYKIYRDKQGAYSRLNRSLSRVVVNRSKRESSDAPEIKAQIYSVNEDLPAHQVARM